MNGIHGNIGGITSILLKPIKTEKTLSLAENNKEVVIEVDKRATKADIANEFEKLFSVKVSEIRTHRTMKGKKRAIIRIADNKKFDDIVSKLKLI